MNLVGTTLSALLLLFASCTKPQHATRPETQQKIAFSLDRLDEDGLRGPPDGKVAVAYEFAVPDTDTCRSEVKSIDSSVQFMPGSRGRIKAGKDECLCIGSTHQGSFREVLRTLAELPYIDRIIECHFE